MPWGDRTGHPGGIPAPIARARCLSVCLSSAPAAAAAAPRAAAATTGSTIWGEHHVGAASLSGASTPKRSPTVWRAGDPIGARSVPERREPSHQRVAPARGARRRDGPGGLMIMMMTPMAVPHRPPGVCARTYCACACCVCGVCLPPLVAIVIAGQRGSIVQLSPGGGCSCLAHEAHPAVGAPVLTRWPAGRAVRQAHAPSCRGAAGRAVRGGSTGPGAGRGEGGAWAPWWHDGRRLGGGDEGGSKVQ